MSGFHTFGLQHLVAVGIVLGSSIGLACAARAAKSARFERVVRWVLAVGCPAFLAFEATCFLWAWEMPLHYVLPLHLCDVSILIAPVVLLTANRYAFELLYFWGIGGALQAIATPTLTRGFPALTCVVFFLGHGLIIASALHATVVMRLRPTPWSILRVWLLTNAYALLMIPVNLALDTNYLFIMRKPWTPSALDLMGPWPWYLAVLDVAALIVILLCYLPFFIRDRRVRSRAA